MTNALTSPMPGVRRIAILRALQLGDLLVAVPALRAIRAGYPEAEITLVGLPWAAAFAARYSRYIDRFVEFPGWPGIAELACDAARTARFVMEQHAYDYDLVVQLHGSGRTSNSFCLALGGRITAGYFDPALGAPPDGMALAAPYPDDQPELLRNLGIAELLGCPVNHPDTTRLEFPLTDADHAEATRLLSALPSPAGRGVGGEVRPLIAIHPGARPPARRWPAERFARLADLLIERLGARIVLTGGPGEEVTAREVAEGMRAGEAHNLAGKTTLGGLAAVLTRVDLFIGNDTGPAHLAEAVGTPTVRIFGPADPARWAPLDTTRHRVVREDVFCSPCGYWECPIDHRCLERIPAERVYAAALELLRELQSASNRAPAAVGASGGRPGHRGQESRPLGGANRQASRGEAGLAPTANRGEEPSGNGQPAQVPGDTSVAPTGAARTDGRPLPLAASSAPQSAQEGAVAWSA